MPLALILLAALTLPGHRDWGLIAKRCEACHVGHGAAGRKLMPMNEPESCLRCHGGPVNLAAMVQQGILSSSAKPPDMSRLMTLNYSHFSYNRCSDCHAGHGIQSQAVQDTSIAKPSTKRSNELEHELCGKCHAKDSIYHSPNSSHPVMAKRGGKPGPSTPSSAPAIVNCSDCHGTADSSLPQGVHGSNYASIIKWDYIILDGSAESESAYQACYACHSRESILNDESFAYHQLHVVEQRTSCYTCHMSHASQYLPFLLAIEDDSRADRILPDSYGRKSFQQDASGVCKCFLTCHNVEHDGWTYGPEGKKRALKSGKMKVMPGVRKGPAAIKPK